MEDGRARALGKIYGENSESNGRRRSVAGEVTKVPEDRRLGVLSFRVSGAVGALVRHGLVLEPRLWKQLR